MIDLSPPRAKSPSSAEVSCAVKESVDPEGVVCWGERSAKMLAERESVMEVTMCRVASA